LNALEELALKGLIIDLEDALGIRLRYIVREGGKRGEIIEERQK